MKPLVHFWLPAVLMMHEAEVASGGTDCLPDSQLLQSLKCTSLKLGASYMQ